MIPSMHQHVRPLQYEHALIFSVGMWALAMGMSDDVCRERVACDKLMRHLAWYIVCATMSGWARVDCVESPTQQAHRCMSNGIRGMQSCMHTECQCAPTPVRDTALEPEIPPRTSAVRAGPALRAIVHILPPNRYLRCGPCCLSCRLKLSRYAWLGMPLCTADVDWCTRL